VLLAQSNYAGPWLLTNLLVRGREEHTGRVARHHEQLYGMWPQEGQVNAQQRGTQSTRGQPGGAGGSKM
jgi:hypothetical protein